MQCNPSAATPDRLDQLFQPASVGIVGASANLESIGGQPIKHLRNAGYAGTIYPINPKYNDIDGLPCYPDITSLPEAPDVMVVAVAANRVIAVVEEAGAKGVPYVVIFSSGFAEAGTDGEAAQRELAEVSRRTGVRIIGPNCQGLINVADGIPIGFGAPYAMTYRTGAVSVSSQSGAFGNSVLMGLNEEGVGLRRYVSTGNEAQTTSLDCIASFLEDPETRVVAGYVEGFRDAHRLRELGRQALQQDKPLVLWKVGNTEAGAQAASSHTANLAGEYGYYDAAFRQYGIVDAHDVGDMADCVRALLTGKRPTGNGVAVLSISGGAGIAMADRCAELGLTLPALAPETIDALRPLLPAFASLNNPVDLTAGALANPQSFADALRVVVKDPNVDMLGICLAALSGEGATLVAREIANVAAETDIPLLVAWSAPPGMATDAYEVLEQAEIPRYASPVRCARGFGATWRFAEAAARVQEMPTRDVQPHPNREDAAALNEFEAKQLLGQYGFPVTREGVAQNGEDAVRLANEYGYPVVMKILSKDIPHKSDAGGVRVGVQDDAAVHAVYEEIAALPKRIGQDVRFEGVLVQEMVGGTAAEVILGAVNDPNFGPVIMFGAGGIFAEIFEDVAFRLAPVNRPEAEALIAQTRISRILRGARGRTEADVDALVDAVLKLSDFAVAESQRFTEIDINPLFVLPKGQGVRAVDAYLRTTVPQ
ncbi:acetate--CoA ligase family protein [Ectothiorhodospiraceae bacterium WFHF3C12]|nr:acetate--CoA ligase family protein [Ectothiorhodospiraceae bacterium WFHF3C12]